MHRESAASADIKAWIGEILVPTWVGAVVDPGAPGFVEWMRPDFTPVASETRTTLVTARLIHVFSHAHCLDPSGPGLAAARHGLGFLLDACRGPDGRFRHAVTTSGAVIDGRSDLYDLAFVLFGLGWYARASGDRTVLDIADAVADFAETVLADPAGGFTEDTLATLPRRQNPHMHLLEAFLLLAEVAPEKPWMTRAEAMVALFRAHLFDAETGSLGEFFDRSWRPAPGAAGTLREPGHHFEWCWLLHQHARLSGDTGVLDLADRLFDFGCAHGLAPACPRGAALDAVDRTGRVVAATKLLWPQTELLKALVARRECGRAKPGDPAPADVLGIIFGHYVDADTGRWLNQLDAAGAPIRADVPVRVLYHLMFALAEYARAGTGA